MKKCLNTICFYAVTVFLVYGIISGVAKAQEKDTVKITLTPKALAFNIESAEYQELLNGYPTSAGIFSGLVTIMPEATVGEHSTEHYEEVLVILSGEGQMIFENGNMLELKFGIMAYCPPHTAHNVKNTGKTPLKYLYIATDTER